MKGVTGNYDEENDFEFFFVMFNKYTSHSGVIQQFIKGLVDHGFASREEIEQHLLDLVPNQLYLESKG